MERTLIANLKGCKQAKVQGFVDNIRDKKSMQFVVIKDRTGKLQVTIEKAKHQDIADIFSALTLGSVVTIIGEVIETSFVKMGGKEMIPEKVEILSRAIDSNPIDENTSIDQRIDFRWLDLRQDKNAMIFTVQSCFINSMREYLLNKNFTEIHTPKLIGTASESGSDVFELKYFDRKAYLAQSPQFYKQMAMASGFERIFEVAPAYRAEASHTSRHTTEFTSFDLELSYIDSVDDIMALEEELICYGLNKVKEKYYDAIKELFGTEVVIPKTAFPRIKLNDLYNEIEKRYGYVVEQSEKTDMTTEAERLAYKYALEEYGSEFIFITDFPKDKRPFYHIRKDDIPQGYDLIWRGTEITTGAQREHRFEILKKQAEEKGLGKDVDFYLQFFRYGCPPHGGFGLGVDRLTMLLLGLPSLKEAMFLFRGPNRLNP